MTDATQARNNNAVEPGAARSDEGKPRLHLVPFGWLVGIGTVFTFGARKYAPHNWRRGMDPLRCYDSAQRHLGAWLEGEQIDPESGLHHLLHAAWNCLAAWSYQTGTGAKTVQRSDQSVIDDLDLRNRNSG